MNKYVPFAAAATFLLWCGAIAWTLSVVFP